MMHGAKTMGGDPGEKSYSGILAEPMPKWGALTRPSDKEVEELIDEKFKALFVHFNLDPADAYEIGPKQASAWANLAWHLARQHLPGFKNAPRTRGRPAERKHDDISLFMHVELLRRRCGLSDRKAIQQIAAQNLVAGAEDALRKRYTNLKRPFRPIAEMFDRAASAIGSEAMVSSLEDALFGDEKEIISPPT
jgi:hypothetical protein